MKVNTAKDIIQINGKTIKKLILMSDSLLSNKPKIKINTFYNPQNQKAILDFLLNKFQKISFLITRLVYFLEVISLFKSDSVSYKGINRKFKYPKKYIAKINSLKDDKKLIKWSKKIKLENKLHHPYSITTIKQKIEYVIFKVPFNNDRDRQFRGKLHLLGYKVLELKIVSFGKISLGSLKEGDLKLSSKFVFKNIVL